MDLFKNPVGSRGLKSEPSLLRFSVAFAFHKDSIYLKEKAFYRGGGANMAFIDQYDFDILKNDAEKMVLQELGRQLEICPAPICLCNECVLDMAAVALNTIKPLYRVSLLGALYTATAMDGDAYATSIKNAVSAAIEKVRENPSHDVAAEEA